MRLISPLLKKVVYPLMSSTGYLRQSAGSGPLCVVTYHGVRPSGYRSIDPMLDGGLVSADSLRAQVRLLKQRYQVISPERFLAWLRAEEARPPRSVLLTCDDGLRNVLSCMVPILQEEEVRCLFFITGASVTDTPVMLWYEELYLLLKAAPAGSIAVEVKGFQSACPRDADRRAFWWQLVQTLSGNEPAVRSEVLSVLREKFGPVMERFREDAADWQRFTLLTTDALQQLSAQGMSIGAHTIHHPMLSRMSDTGAQAEIAGSRELLEKTLGRNVWALAYPFGNPGSFTAREVALAQAAQFTCAFANAGGGFGADLPRFALPRVHVTADMNLGEFEAHVSGFYRKLRRGPDTVRGGAA